MTEMHHTYAMMHCTCADLSSQPQEETSHVDGDAGGILSVVRVARPVSEENIWMMYLYE